MISDIISLLGFLRDINDNNERSVKEQELFEVVKQLMIEFLEFITKNMNDKTFFQEYQICLGLKHISGSSLCDIGENNVALLYTSIYFLKSNYKLTTKQTDMILDILNEMTPKIIEKTYISFLEDKDSQSIFFHIRSSKYQEVMDRSCSTLTNIVMLPQRLEEIKKGDWDNLIKTSIKELG